MTERLKLLNALGCFLACIFLTGSLDVWGHLFPFAKTKTNLVIHTSSINTLSEKDKIQVTLKEQSLVIGRIVRVGNAGLMFAAEKNDIEVS